MSPQFKGPVTPGGRRRRRQPSRTQTTRARGHVGNQSDHVTGHTRHQQNKHYQSLQFLGGGPRASISPLEELTIDSQEEVRRRRSKNKATTNEQTMIHEPKSPDTDKAENRPPVNLSLDAVRTNVKELFSDESSYSDSGTPQRKVSKTCAKKPKQKSRRNRHKDYNDSDSSLDVPGGAHEGSFSSEHIGTQKRPTLERQCSSKRLFGGNNENENSSSPHREMRSRSRSRTPLRTLQEKRLLERLHPDPSLSPAASPCNSPMPADVCTPGGVEENYLFAPLLQTPLQGQLPPDCRVLVYDTPEEDYGLPVRLRRQKYKHNKSLLK